MEEKKINFQYLRGCGKNPLNNKIPFVRKGEIYSTCVFFFGDCACAIFYESERVSGAGAVTSIIEFSQNMQLV